MRVTVVIQRHKPKSRRLADAFVKPLGSRARVMYEPAIEHLQDTRQLYVFIGCWPTTVKQLKYVKDIGANFAYVDNGYFKPYRQGGYFRATCNAMQHSGEGSSDGTRFRLLDVPVKKWRPYRPGKPILVVKQSPRWQEMYPTAANLPEFAARLKQFTKRPFLFREKPDGQSSAPDGLVKPIAAEINDSHAVVAFSSNVLVEAVTAGVPVLATGPCAARTVSCLAEDIEKPAYPECRENWLNVLADNQFTIEEMESGMCWDRLLAQISSGNRELG